MSRRSAKSLSAFAMRAAKHSKFEKPCFMEMNDNKLWKLLIDRHMTKTEAYHDEQ